ncbi:MAG: hypothetical protein AABX93_00235 [Nanoarchaeota archaeon]
MATNNKGNRNQSKSLADLASRFTLINPPLKFPKDRTGADKILSVYWFAILFIVASGVFAMVYVFYTSPFDVRNVEADAIGNQIVSCISQNGKIISRWTTNQTSLKIRDECHLDFDSESNENQYYVQIDFYDFKTFQFSISNGTEVISSQPLTTVYDGNANLKTDCEVGEIKNYNKQSKCLEKRFYAVDEKNNLYTIKITSAVRKTEKNAKL